MNDNSEQDWDAWFDQYLNDRNQNLDERWGFALDALVQHKDLNGVLTLMAGDEPVPRWARKIIRRWRDGGYPPFPTMKDGDKELLAAWRAYRDKTTRRAGETRDDHIKRIADEHKVSESSLRNVLDGKGRAYCRLILDWNEWQRIYITEGIS